MSYTIIPQAIVTDGTTIKNISGTLSAPALNFLPRSVAENALKIMVIEADAAIGSTPYDLGQADVYTAAAGYSSTIDTAETTATYDAAADSYNNITGTTTANSPTDTAGIGGDNGTFGYNRVSYTGAAAAWRITELRFHQNTTGTTSGTVKNASTGETYFFNAGSSLGSGVRSIAVSMPYVSAADVLDVYVETTNANLRNNGTGAYDATLNDLRCEKDAAVYRRPTFSPSSHFIVFETATLGATKIRADLSAQLQTKTNFYAYSGAQLPAGTTITLGNSTATQTGLALNAEITASISPVEWVEIVPPTAAIWNSAGYVVFGW